MTTKQFGIIFDFDGTLFDDTHIIGVLIRKFAASLDAPPPRAVVDELERRVINGLAHTYGKGAVVKLFLGVAKDLGVPWYRRIPFLLKVKRSSEEEMANCTLFDGAGEVLDQLAQETRIGLFTTTPHAILLNRLQATPQFLARFGESIVTGDRVKKTKPDPEGILTIVHRWGVPTSRVVMVGDSEVDILAAQRANCISAGVLTGYSSRADMEEAGADFIFQDLQDLYDRRIELWNKLNQ